MRKKSIWDKRIPTILGLFLITISIVITSYFVKQGIFFIIKANPINNPQEVRISNITDSSATISFLTNGEVVGSINFGETKESLQKILDDKDQEEETVTPRKIHNFTVRNLKPLTKYYFSITSGQETYLNNGVLYELTTGAKINTDPPLKEPITGKLLLPTGQPPKEAIIYALIDGSQLISTTAKRDSTYILPLNSIRDKDFLNYFSVDNNSIIKMTIIGDGYTSKIILLGNQINPVPQIILSKNYDFTISYEPESTESAKFEKLPSFSADLHVSENTTTSLSITFPYKENQEIQDLQPEFRGNALPNKSVKIIINSETKIEAIITADNYGNWNYRPKIQLSPGQHTVTIISEDAQGILKTITKSFIVYAEGSLFTDTISGTPTPTPTIIPTLTPTNTPTPIIKIGLSPTSAVVTYTPTPTPTQILIASPTSNLIIATNSPTLIPNEKMVNGSSYLSFGFLGILITIIGITLLVLSRGSISL